jgi:hypothetical protein
MPLLGYKSQFAALVESGEKRQTIRAMRKRPFKVGDRLYHYTGLRTKACRKLLESDCTAADDIFIDKKGNVYINGRCLYESAKESFAYADGFRHPGFLWAQMLEFFKTVHGLPFTGQIIKW